MKQWLRLKGLFVFVLFVVLLVVTAFFAAAPLTKTVLVSALTSANGAIVDIRNLNIQYSPLTVMIEGVEVTDPESPMMNSLEIDQAVFSVSFADLLFKKLHIEEMSITGIKINTARTYSGAIEQIDEEAETIIEQPSADAPVFSVELPEIDDILKNETLKSDAIIAAVEEDIDQAKLRWEKIDSELGDKQKWKQYEQRYKDIRKRFKGNTLTKLKALKDAKKLSKDLKAEQRKIKTAKQGIKQDIDQIHSGIGRVKNSIKDDRQRLKAKYAGGKDSAMNFIGLIFGEKTAEVTHLIKQWYGRIAPYIETEEEQPAPERGSGQFITFTEYNPTPDFYLRKASLQADLPLGAYHGEIKDLSSDQAITARPATMLVKSDSKTDDQREILRVEYNALEKNNRMLKADYQVKSYPLQQFEVSADKAMPIIIDTALLAVQARAVINNNGLDVNADVDFSQVSFKSSGKNDGSYKAVINSALGEIRSFDLRATASGKIKSLKLNVKSNIDRKLGKSVKQVMKKRFDVFEKKLEQKLRQRYADKLNKLESVDKDIKKYKAELDNKQQALRDKLKGLKK